VEATAHVTPSTTPRMNLTFSPRCTASPAMGAAAQKGRFASLHQSKRRRHVSRIVERLRTPTCAAQSPSDERCAKSVLNRHIPRPPWSRICPRWRRRRHHAIGDVEEATAALPKQGGYSTPCPGIPEFLNIGPDGGWGGGRPPSPSRQATWVVPVAARREA
jgi:hypothetical protein